jgi:diguanylate cyclase (GGDEF)-like protein
MVSKDTKDSVVSASLRNCLEASFPPVTLRLLNELVQPEPSFDEITNTIKMDTGLAANVLGLVNSPFYGLSKKVTDLKQAAVVLGTRELLKTTLSASFVSAMSNLHPDKDAYPSWRVMVWSAIASELIAERICPQDSSQIYLCALLKDLSLLLVSKADLHRLPECLDGRVINCLQEGQLNEELDIWGLTHPELTLKILDELGIEGLSCGAIVHHHDMESLDQLDDQAKAVTLGTRWAELAVGNTADAQSMIRFESLLKTILAVSDDDLDALRRRLLEKFRSMLAALGIEESAPDQRLYELSIQDMQKYYFQSMDLVGVSGGPEVAAKTIARHVRWSFGIDNFEVMLREPLTEHMTIFSGGKDGVRRTGGPAPAGEVEWGMRGLRYEIATEAESWGELRVSKKLSRPLQQELGVYVRFMSQAYEQYCLRRSMLEMKAHTLDNLPVGVARLDSKGRTLQINRRLAEFLAISPAEKDVTRYLPVSRFFGAEQEWSAFLADEDKRDFTRIFCAEGILKNETRDRCLYFSANKRKVLNRDEILLLVEDVTEVSGLEMQALKQREFLEKLVASMRDIVIITDHSGYITYASPALPSDTVGRSLFEIANPVGPYGGLWGPHYLEDPREPVEAVMLTSDRELKPFELIISPLQPTLGHNQSYLVVGRDLSVIRRLEEKLKRQAIYDGLTQLFNHDYFHTLLSREIKRDKRIDRGRTAIIFIDLDGFKEINDQLGHQAGDEALRSVAGAIKKNVRAGMDYPCRYGGDEFVVILTEVENEGIKRLAARIKKGINQCWKQYMSASIGVALGHEDEPATSLLKRADQASYKAKTSGGDRVVFAE